MSNTLKRVLLILLACVVAWWIISAIVGIVVRIFTIVLIGAVVLFLLSLGSKDDD